jgi:hypothetical protein
MTASVARIAAPGPQQQPLNPMDFSGFSFPVLRGISRGFEPRAFTLSAAFTAGLEDEEDLKTRKKSY